jgi:hypothetical protein
LDEQEDLLHHNPLLGQGRAPNNGSYNIVSGLTSYQAPLHSESAANLLILLTSNFRVFSEKALI